jgi:hypothetical protein
VFQQGGRELVERVKVRGKQFPRAGFGLDEQRGDFPVDQPLSALGVATWRERGVRAGRLVGVADRA